MEKRHKRQGGGWQRRMRRKEAEIPLLKRIRMTRPPLVEREIQFHRFREALGETRFASFVGYLRTEGNISSSVKLDSALNEGKSLLDLVLTGEACRGYWFNFQKYPRDCWALGFGYSAPFAGESGVWAVIFDSAGKIARIRLWRSYIS